MSDDALCGPSNALQNFNKHAAVDRTLQQDRLATRHAPAQGFRSQTPRDGILDPEFAAFEANHGGPALPDFQHHAHHAMPTQFPTNVQPAPNWAMDFQNLQISNPTPPQMQAPSAVQHQGGWQNEFVAQQQHSQTMATHLPQTNFHMNRPYGPSFAPSFPMYGSSASTFQTPQQTRSGPIATTETFDDAAFDAAFEQARADLEYQQQSLNTEPEPEPVQVMTARADFEHQQPLNTEPEPEPVQVMTARADFEHQQPVNTEPEPVQAMTTQTENSLHETDLDESLNNASETISIGSDTIIPADQQIPKDPTHEANALAQTAGELLGSVSHEQNDKFKNSTFLELMRRIRDREVEVQGDEFRDVSNP